MSPITHLPQSGGAEPFSVRAKRAGSPQRISNGHTSTKSNGILSPKKTPKRFFRRNTLEKNQVGEAGTAQSNEKKKTSTPKVEIIYKDSPQSGNESDESNIASLKKAFEADGSPSLCTASTHSGERTPSTYSDEFIQSTSLSLQGLDVNMNRISTGSAASHTERVVQEILSTERAYVQHLHDIIEGYLKKMRKKNSPFSKQDVKELFMNIEEIYEFNKTFLAELEELDDDPVDVASHFVSKDIQKHFDKENYPEGYDIISDALSAMTGVAHHINEMKRQHEQAVHVQEIQSQMSDFEGPDLTTYGSLVLEDTFRIHNTRTDRHLFLFEKILLITKRKEGGYSCKASLMLSNMMLSESIPKEPLAFEIIRFDNQKNSFVFLARNAEQKRKWTLELKGLIVDSLTAQVPKEAKALILGKKEVKERGEQENHDNEGKKRSRPAEKLNRGTQQLKALKNTRLLVTVTADFVDVNRLRTSYNGIHRILEQTAFNNSDRRNKKDAEKKSDDEGEPRPPSDVYSSDDEKKSLGPQSILSDREDDLEPCEEANEDESGISSESAAGQVGVEEQGLRAQDTNKGDKLVSLLLL
ncbi:unnamed protein product [Porites evermanni]|uniref:PH domain-containing protein n=1 Tax=Porites evermanni TaxID=104178 RepID=A0ABN8RDL2_9CNID|nr:unnamed protein product [Porites evermanni]